MPRLKGPHPRFYRAHLQLHWRSIVSYFGQNFRFGPYDKPCCESR